MKLNEYITSVLNEDIEAYHGSPFKFNKFDTDKMSSGAGVQAFGWGIYLADLVDRVKEYTGYDRWDVKIDGRSIRGTLNKELQYIIRTYGTNQAKVLEVLKDNVQRLVDDGVITQDDYDVIMNAQKLTLQKSNTIYQVRVHKGRTSNQYDYLVWRGDVTDQQIQKIQQQIIKDGYSGRVTIEDGKVYKTWGDKEQITTGGDIYRAFAGDEGFTPKKASLFLLDAGIDGIKYKADGGWDYVVFDPKEISIIKKTKI